MRYPTAHEVIESMSVSYQWKDWELVSVEQFGELSMNSFSIVYWKDGVQASYHGRIKRGKGTAPWIMQDVGSCHVRLDVHRSSIDRLPLGRVYGKHTDEVLSLMRLFPDSLVTFIDNEMDWDDEEHVFGYVASTDDGIIQGYLPLNPTDETYEEFKAGPIETNPVKMYALSINESETIKERAKD